MKLPDVERLFMQTQMKALEAENARLRSEVAVARERLGPAGWNILEKYMDLQANEALLKDVVEAAGYVALNYPGTPAEERLRNALRKLKDAKRGMP